MSTCSSVAQTSSGFPSSRKCYSMSRCWHLLWQYKGIWMLSSCWCCQIPSLLTAMIFCFIESSSCIMLVLELLPASFGMEGICCSTLTKFPLFISINSLTTQFFRPLPKGGFVWSFQVVRFSSMGPIALLIIVTVYLMSELAWDGSLLLISSSKQMRYPMHWR